MRLIDILKKIKDEIPPEDEEARLDKFLELSDGRSLIAMLDEFYAETEKS